MKILIINPWLTNLTNSFFGKHFDRGNGNNLVCQILASVTPKHHFIKMVNDFGDNIDFDSDVDLIALTTFTRSAPRTYAIADGFKKRGKKVVLGGWHASALPNEAKQHADSVVIGEGEDIFPKLLKDLEKNELKPFYEQEKPVDINSVPILTREERKKYEISSFTQSVEITKGCPTGCNFCSISNRKFGKLHRTKTIKNAIKELESIPQKYIIFSDASLTINPNYTKQLFREMKGLNKIFSCEGNVNILGKDEELLKLASEAGCLCWYTGFESINQETIDSMGKSTNKVENYKNVIDKIHDYGMLLEGALMFGFDTDGPNVFISTLESINNWNIDIMDFSTLTPYPGTPLFIQLEKEGRILTREWEKYDCSNVVFKPKQMTPDELYYGVKGLRKEFHTPIKVLKRSAKSIKFGIYPFITTYIRNNKRRSMNI